jgi:DNA-directed RNA polymerase subunit N (RpoN/RPB10)
MSGGKTWTYWTCPVCNNETPTGLLRCKTCGNGIRDNWESPDVSFETIADLRRQLEQARAELGVLKYAVEMQTKDRLRRLCLAPRCGKIPQYVFMLVDDLRKKESLFDQHMPRRSTAHDALIDAYPLPPSAPGDESKGGR